MKEGRERREKETMSLPKTSWWSRSRNSREIFNRMLPAENAFFDEEGVERWQFFAGSLEDLQAPSGFVWRAVPVACNGATALCRSRPLPPCPLGFPPPVPVGREDVLADVAVVSVGPSSFLAENHAETVSPGIWVDPAVLFCTPSAGLCWLWSELGFAEQPPGTDESFDVDELCLIAMEARLGAESGFDLVNTATFGESTCLWDADAAARLSCVLRPGGASCSGSGLSRKRERQRSSSPRPLAFSGETRCRGRSLDRKAGAVSCVAGTVQ